MIATPKPSALETFVPLMPLTGATRPTTFASLNVSSLPQPAIKLAADPGKPALAASDAPPAACSKPTVTLQRTGDIVTSIRVECACEWVMDLSCVY